MKRALLAAVLLAACGPSHPAAVPHPPPPPDAGVAVAPPDAAAKPADPPPPELRLPTTVAPTHYALTLELDPDKDTFTGHVAIDVAVSAATPVIWLDADNLEIAKATLTSGGTATPLQPATTSKPPVVGYKTGTGAIAPGSYTLAFDYTGHVGNDMNGLFREQMDGHWYEYTQGESTFARKYIPCFDEPSFKVPWSVKLIVPAAQKAYANAPMTKDTPTADGRHELDFADTPAIPSYLVAVTVGPFEEVDVGKIGRNKIPSRVIVPTGHSGEAGTTAKALPKIVAALEDYFDMPLPFDKLDAVVVPSFFGAMENPGLVTFDSRILLAKPDDATFQFRSNMTSIVAHEFAHQWFGDYVTLAWWDDLWLNESFATWMADKITAQLEPTWDHAANQLRSSNRAMEFDGRSTAQPLHREITAGSDIESTFDAIAYDKGGAVLTMFEHWIGADHFRDGVRAYMKAHARGNASADDFVSALVDVSHPDVGAAFHQYLDQAGVPELSLSLTCAKGQPPSLHVHQQRLVGFGEQATDQRWPVSLCLRYGAGGKKSQDQCAPIELADTDVPLTGACPTWIAGNVDGAGYYRTHYDADLTAKLYKHLADLPSIARMVLASDQGALLDAGQVSAKDTLALVAPLLATKDVHGTSSAVNLVIDTLPLVDDALMPNWRAWVIRQLGKAAEKAPLIAPKGETPPEHDARKQLLGVVGILAQDAKLDARARKAVQPWLDGKGKLPDDGDVLLSMAARAGDAKLFDAMLAKARASEGNDRVEALTALGGFTDPALIAKADDLVTSGEFDLMQVGGLLQLQLQSPEGARAVAAWLRDHWDAITAKLPKLVQPYLVYMQAPSACDADGRAALKSFMDTHAASIPGGDKATSDTLGIADSCIARRTALAGDLAAIIGTSRSAKAKSTR